MKMAFVSDIVLFFVISGCTTASMSIDKAAVTMMIGTLEQLTVTGNPAPDSLEWSSDNIAVAEVSDTGLVKAGLAGKAAANR